MCGEESLKGIKMVFIDSWKGFISKEVIGWGKRRI